MTKFQAGTIHTCHVMDCQVHAIGKGYKTPFHRSGHIQVYPHTSCAAIANTGMDQ